MTSPSAISRQVTRFLAVVGVICVMVGAGAKAGAPEGEAMHVFQEMKKGICVKFDLADPYAHLDPATHSPLNIYLDMIGSAGFTAVRSFFNSSRTPQSYEQAVKEALRRGLAVNLCMFAWPGITREQYVAKWKEVASFYRDYPRDLVFEMMNEPMLAPKIKDNDEVMEWIGGAVAAVREISPDRILLVGGPQFMQAPWLDRVNPDTIRFARPGGGGFVEDGNIFGAFHMYEPGRYTMPKGQTNTLEDIPDWRGVVTAAFDRVEEWSRRWGKPVVMTEWAAQNNLKIHSDFLAYTKFVAEQAKGRNIASFYYCGVPDNRMVWSILNTERGWDQGVLDILTGVTAPMTPPLNQIIDPCFARKGAWGFSDESRFSSGPDDGKKVLAIRIGDAAGGVSMWQDGSTTSERQPGEQGGPAGGHISGVPILLRKDSDYGISFRARAKQVGATVAAKIEKPGEGRIFYQSEPLPLDAAWRDYCLPYAHRGPEASDVRLSFEFKGAGCEIQLEKVMFVRGGP